MVGKENDERRCGHHHVADVHHGLGHACTGVERNHRTEESRHQAAREQAVDFAQKSQLLSRRFGERSRLAERSRSHEFVHGT
jgi:hypothetical protein